MILLIVSRSAFLAVSNAPAGCHWTGLRHHEASHASYCRPICKSCKELLPVLTLWGQDTACGQMADKHFTLSAKCAHGFSKTP